MPLYLWAKIAPSAAASCLPVSVTFSSSMSGSSIGLVQLVKKESSELWEKTPLSEKFPSLYKKGAMVCSYSYYISA